MQLFLGVNLSGEFVDLGGEGTLFLLLLLLQLRGGFHEGLGGPTVDQWFTLFL